MKKKFSILTVICLLLATLALAACNDFENPGDNLGGGGVGDVAVAVDTTAVNAVKAEMQNKADLGTLAGNTSESGATTVAATSEVVSISQSGTYRFTGQYGGIKIAKNDLTLHFIFDGATVAKSDGVAIDGTDSKKTKLVITLKEGTTNTVTNGGDDVNAIHVKGTLSFNGKGTLNVTSESKSAVKCSKAIQIVDATLNLKAANHAITGSSVAASNCKIAVTSAGKDGINAECDDYTEQESFTDDGFVCLTDVNYVCNVNGDGIQANTAVYVNGGSYDITTTGNFVQKTASNMDKYDMTNSDFKYTKSGDTYVRVASDETGRYGSNLYGLSQGCKGIKVSEIEYQDENKKTVTVYDVNYLIAIDGGTFSINSTDDAINCNSGNVLIEGGKFDLATLDDGITSDLLTKITGGEIDVTASYEGIEGGYVEITGGTVSVVSTDDGINAASDFTRVIEHIIISGGKITVDAGGDGIDSNGSILISGGEVVVHGPTTGGDAGLDADRGIVVTGGTLFVTSTLGMVETPSSNSTQCVVSYAQNSAISAGSVISLKDSKGNVLLEVEVKKGSCQSIILSHPDLKTGAKYSIYNGSKKLQTFTVSSVITSIGVSTQGGFGRPGGGGNPPPRR